MAPEPVVQEPVVQEPVVQEPMVQEPMVPGREVPVAGDQFDTATERHVDLDPAASGLHTPVPDRTVPVTSAAETGPPSRESHTPSRGSQSPDRDSHRPGRDFRRLPGSLARRLLHRLRDRH
jgi:hypothetical protein